MSTKKIFALVATVAMILLMASSALSSLAVSSPQGVPKIDEILFKTYPGATVDVVVEEFLTGVTEFIRGPGRKDLYDSVIDAGHEVSTMDPMAEFGAMMINCREFKLTSLESNFPLNDASFRMSLSYIYGMDEKQEDIYSYVQAPWTFALGNPIPPAQEPWYDASMVMPDTDWDIAWSILQADGYEVVDNHLSKGGVALRDLEVMYTAGSLFAEQGPINGFATNFNEFITWIGATAPTMTIIPVEFMTWVTELLSYRDFDMISFGFTNLGVYADWISPWIHRRGLEDWGWNSAGIEDDDFDVWADIIITSLDVDEVVEAYSSITFKFLYELMPWFPVNCGLEFCTTWSSTEKTLTNIISMPNYGPVQGWTISGMHWMGEEYGGTVKMAIGDEPHTMNPWTEDTLYGWDIMGNGIDGLITREPIGLTLIPTTACAWEVNIWTSIPELGITEGATATFWLRQDVTWQDGMPVTAYDCVNNMRLMRKYTPGRYSTVWQSLVYEEADGPYKFNVYFYSTGLAQATDVAGTALLAPKHIMDLVEQQVEDGTLLLWEDWDPCFNSYKDLTGEDPPAEYPFMTQLIGSGPYVFDYYDRSLATGRNVKYEDYYVSAGALGAVIGEWRVDPDTTYPYEVLVQNWMAKSVTETSSEVVSVTVDVKVYEDNVLAHEETITLNPYEFMHLGPYTTGALAVGEHTVKVEIYEEGTLCHTYIHTLVATIREDVNTYTGEKLDFTIDIRDIARTAKAFGSSALASTMVPPTAAGLRWDPAC
ncbi:MAG: ABC transporter substrate-binding protein, partial [Candidatus Bathyarchaeota archaeon]|nr:ABC transporter substrate-binding protein [Candidatus Bathyarchaeota archaeon]